MQRYLEACRAKGATSQEQRAVLFGIPRQAVSRYETGKVEPLVSTAQWIAGRIDLTVEDLWVSERAAA
jgi:DNA-binding XRE family transcriptional regulator